MKLYLLKRDHHEGQCFYGVYESEELASEQIIELKKLMPRVPVSEYIIKEVLLNELTEIDSYE